jgi:hypothetical protein
MYDIHIYVIKDEGISLLWPVSLDPEVALGLSAVASSSPDYSVF